MCPVNLCVTDYTRTNDFVNGSRRVHCAQECELDDSISGQSLKRTASTIQAMSCPVRLTEGAWNQPAVNVSKLFQIGLLAPCADGPQPLLMESSP